MRLTHDTQCGIAYAPAGSEPFFDGIAPDFELVLQEGADLGARLNHVINTCFARGYSRVAVLSCDTPLVNPRDIELAFEHLSAGYDVALGPCDDGGYYLLALRESHPELLLPIKMSTPHVVTDTLAAAAQARLCVALLPLAQDVDVADDLVNLKNQLQQLPAQVARHTRQWLLQNHP